MTLSKNQKNEKLIMVLDGSNQTLYLYNIEATEQWEIEKFVQEKDHSADYRVVVELKDFKDERK
jgi:hypothetical protein